MLVSSLPRRAREQLGVGLRGRGADEEGEEEVGWSREEEEREKLKTLQEINQTNKGPAPLSRSRSPFSPYVFFRVKTLIVSSYKMHGICFSFVWK